MVIRRQIMIRSWLVAVLISLGVARVSAAEEVKLGYVDLHRALNEIDEGRKAKANLKKVFDQKQKELDEQQQEIKKAADDLDKKRTLLPADTVRQKEAELANKLQKVQATYMRHQQDLQQKEAEATQPIYDRMQRIIIKIANSENLTMVLDKTQAGVVYAK